MTATKIIQELVERFDRNYEAYRNPSYNETQTRQEFINPMFKALGWDIDNEQGYAEAYKDVIHEDAIKVEGATKAPDYCFRVGGTRKFFLEAKKPSINLAQDEEAAFQLRRYAWSAKLPVSILTDFEEFIVYDCRLRPKVNDKPSKARVLNLKYRDYVDKWSEISSIFSRDAVLKGSFDKFAESALRKRGTSEVDEEFLAEIEEWRESLARNIALRNRKLSARELNYAVQLTIDRIVFLRICEDRRIESYGRLRQTARGSKVYESIFQLFHQADQRYNSGLFHFQKEKGRSSDMDSLTPSIRVDDKPLKAIIKRLYYPESPYEFSVLPADILGHIYEQFLGKVITLTKGHQARIEEKPEVRKAGGVFYTPTYIVDYIVENTVGKLLKDKTPGTSGTASKLRVLDPACGSGSFLLGAYQYLLNWHLDRYTEKDTKKWTRGKSATIFQDKFGEWRLTTAERKRILLNNIYGVDIDSQAVEVTKLSLLLKVLEEESSETIDSNLKLFHERALPDLGENVKCGNSLIAPNYYDGWQSDLFDEEERYRVNVFDWHSEFKSIMEAGGFDAIIGNPPYIPMELMTPNERQYYQSHYSQVQRKYDTAALFVLAQIPKLKRGGGLGYITSLTWQTGENYSAFREYIFASTGVNRIVNLPYDVFKNAYVDTGVFILTAAKSKFYEICRIPKKAKIESLEGVEYTRVNRDMVVAPDFKVVLDPVAQGIVNRASRSNDFALLGDFTASTQGLAGGRFTLRDKPLSDEWFPMLVKGQVYRYRIEIEETKYANLGEFRSLIQFYEEAPKILIRRVVNRQDRLMSTYFDQELVLKKDVNPFVITDDAFDPYYVLAIMNSSLISYLYVNTSSIATKDDFRQTTLAELRRIPIPVYDPEDTSHTKLVSLAKSLLSKHDERGTAKTAHDQKMYGREIEAMEKDIDKIVFVLYALSDTEVSKVTLEYWNK